jgi:predicted RNase H-like HicB family nuclease
MSAWEQDERQRKLAQEASDARDVHADVAEDAEDAEDDGSPGEVILDEAAEASATPTEAEEVSAATFDVYLEEQPGGGTLARILDLPGCYANGANRQEALERLQQATAEYHAWLRRHDEYTPEVRGPFVFIVKEVFEVPAAGEVHGFFTPDAAPATEEDIEWALTLLGWQREDVLALVGALDDAALDWMPADTPDASSIRQVLDALAQREIGYMARLDEQPPQINVSALPGPTVDRLQRVRQAALLRVKNYPKDLRGKVFTHDGEQWSLRKALRLAVWNERAQMGKIEELLAGYRSSH